MNATQAARYRELRKLPKTTLASMQRNLGGLLPIVAYQQWTKDELIMVIIDMETPGA